MVAKARFCKGSEKVAKARFCKGSGMVAKARFCKGLKYMSMDCYAGPEEASR